MASFLTYNNIIDILTDIANRHQQINTFYVGENWEIENDADIVYPVLQVYPTLARMPRNDFGEFKTIQINMNMKVLDLTRQDNENEKDIYSDMLQVAQDIINELSQNPYFSNSNVSILNDISITPLNEFNDDYTNGWEWELSFQLINNNTWCGLPFDPIEGISYNGPVSTGYTYTATFGCADLVDCPIIVDLGDDIRQINSILSGLTFSGTTNYYSRFTSGGSISNGMIWDDGISGVNFMGTAENTAINIISPVGYYYPSLSFYNNGGNPTGSITGYGSELYINGGLKVHPNYINLPYHTPFTLLYTDANNYVKPVTIGSNLSFSTGGTLSVTGLTSEPTTNIQASTTSLTPNITLYSEEVITTLSTGLTINAPTGTPVNGQTFIIRIKDDGTVRTLTWDSIYRFSLNNQAPANTTINKTAYFYCKYNSTDTKWDVMWVNNF